MIAGVHIRPGVEDDLGALNAVDNHYVRETHVTFDIEPVASPALHERFGFRQVAHFSEQGRKFGKFWDVVTLEPLG